MHESTTEVGITVRSDSRLFTINAISAATSFGGPVGGTILLARNYRAMDKPAEARLSLGLGLVGCFVILIALIAIPEDVFSRMPHAAIPIIWGLIGYAIAAVFQGDAIRTHLDAGGRKGSALGAIGGAVAGFAATVPMVMLILFSIPSTEMEHFTMEDSAHTIYYQGAVSSEQATLTGNLLTTIGYFQPGEEGAAILERHGDYFNLVLGLEQEYWDAPELDYWMEALIIDLQRHFTADVTVTARSFTVLSYVDKVFSRPLDDL